MASTTPLVVAIVIAIILLGVAIYYVSTRPSLTTTTTLPPISTTITESTSYTTSMSSSIVSSTTSTSTTSVSSTTSTTTNMTSSLPAGAMTLPYNPSNKTVFLYLDSSSSGNPLNYNGTGNDAIRVYIPAGWTLIVIYTNYASLNHDVVILQNTTATPNSSDIGNDGKILAVAGGTPTNYEMGISTGSTASTSVTLPAGAYWFACGVPGHALAGMWGTIIASTSVTTPYVIITS